MVHKSYTLKETRPPEFAGTYRERVRPFDRRLRQREIEQYTPLPTPHTGDTQSPPDQTVRQSPAPESPTPTTTGPGLVVIGEFPWYCDSAEESWVSETEDKWLPGARPEGEAGAGVELSLNRPKR